VLVEAIRHYKASCYYYLAVWECEKLQVMKVHLANYCENCSENISNYWHQKLIEETDIVHIQTNDLQDMDCFSLEVKHQIDQSLLKAWVIAGIPFEVIEYPFIKDLFKKLKYDPPSHSILSGRLLEVENYSSEILTDEFLLLEIFNLIEDIGSEKFAAVVTDATSNCYSARKKIQAKYSYLGYTLHGTYAVNISAVAEIMDLEKDLSSEESSENFECTQNILLI
ncbi:17784_t:CDS:2, partial [Gigaspora margarita]